LIPHKTSFDPNVQYTREKSLTRPNTQNMG
jgi:hypothetical protein